MRAKFESIDNHVVEPSGEMLAQYKSRVSDLETKKQLTDVSCTWNQQCLDEYMESAAGSDGGKFHLISAMHSLYYVENQGTSLKYLLDKLEYGGLLVIMMQDGRYPGTKMRYHETWIKIMYYTMDVTNDNVYIIYRHI